MAVKKKVLYMMHFDWSWIKQRPQFIEEELEKNYEIHITCAKNYRIKNNCNKDNMSLFYRIPIISRFRQLEGINFYKLKLFIQKHIQRFNPDIIYITSPEYIEGIPLTYKGKIVYDCMDDMIEFSPTHKKESMLRFEQRLVKRADIVIVSSERLKSVLSNRNHSCISKLNLIRNGYNGNIMPVGEHLKNQLYTFCYFGTLGSWFDFEILIKSLADFPDIQYLLIGPKMAGTIIPKHDRLIHVPAVDHSELFEKTRNADAFIMPFKINDIVLGVDPIKLYEYINFNKNILCVEYPEVKRFEAFVFFYHNYESFCSQIKRMKELSEPKYTNEERLEFLRPNTWEERTKEIVALLEA